MKEPPPVGHEGARRKRIPTPCSRKDAFYFLSLRLALSDQIHACAEEPTDPRGHDQKGKSHHCHDEQTNEGWR